MLHISEKNNNGWNNGQKIGELKNGKIMNLLPFPPICLAGLPGVYVYTTDLLCFDFCRRPDAATAPVLQSVWWWRREHKCYPDIGTGHLPAIYAPG